MSYVHTHLPEECVCGLFLHTKNADAVCMLHDWDTQERCLSEEMDAMDSSSDNGSDVSDDSDEPVDGGVERKSSCTNDLDEVENTCDDKDLTGGANATLEWSQFMNSTEGMLQYMEEATATLQGVSSLVISFPSLEQKMQESTTVGVPDQEQGYSSAGALFSPSRNKTQLETTTLPAEVFARLSCAGTIEASLADQLGPTTARAFVSHDRIRSDSSVLNKPGSMECRASVAKQADLNERDRMVVAEGIPPQNLSVKEHSPLPSSPGSPGRLEPNLDTQISVEPPRAAVSATESNRSFTGDASMQNPPVSLVDNGEISIPKEIGSQPELRSASRVFETGRIFTSQQEVPLLDQVKSEFTCFEGGIPAAADVISQIDVMASVGENEVARRIGREKARCVEARQQRRKDSITQ